MRAKNKNILIAGLVIVLVAGALIIFVLGRQRPDAAQSLVTNYEGCVLQRDTKILQTYPEQCVYEGRSFVYSPSN